MSTEFTSIDGLKWEAKTEVGVFLIAPSDTGYSISFDNRTLCKGICNIEYAFESALSFYETFKNRMCKCKTKK